MAGKDDMDRSAKQLIQRIMYAIPSYDAVAIASLRELKLLVSQSAESLDWMVQHFNYINQTDSPGKEDSPELRKAKELLERLR